MVRVNDNKSLSFSYDELLTCKEQVTVGEDYYVFNQIVVGLTVISYEEVTLNSITDDADYPFVADGIAYSYAIRVPEKKLRFMTFEEIKEYWLGHQTEVFGYHAYGQDGNCNEYINAMITGFKIDTSKDGKSFVALAGQWIPSDVFVRYATKENGTTFLVEED